MVYFSKLPNENHVLMCWCSNGECVLVCRSLVDCMQAELSTSLPMFLEDRDDINEEEGSTAHVSPFVVVLLIIEFIYNIFICFSISTVHV